MEPNGTNLLKTLVSLLAEQESVKIEYIVERGINNDKTYQETDSAAAAS